MKILNQSRIFSFCALLTVLFGSTACDPFKNDPDFEEYIIKLGTVYKYEAERFCIITDDTLAIYPNNVSAILSVYQPVDGQRCIIYYMDPVKSGDYEFSWSYDAKVDYLYEINTRPIYYTSRMDTLADHRIDVERLSLSTAMHNGSHFLNMNYRLFLYGGENMILLRLCADESEPVVQDNYYHLHIRYDNQYHEGGEPVQGLISFALDPEVVAEGLSGLKLHVNTAAYGPMVFTLDY